MKYIYTETSILLYFIQYSLEEESYCPFIKHLFPNEYFVVCTRDYMT